MKRLAGSGFAPTLEKVAHAQVRQWVTRHPCCGVPAWALTSLWARLDQYKRRKRTSSILLLIFQGLQIGRMTRKLRNFSHSLIDDLPDRAWVRRSPSSARCDFRAYPR